MDRFKTKNLNFFNLVVERSWAQRRLWLSKYWAKTGGSRNLRQSTICIRFLTLLYLLIYDHFLSGLKTLALTVYSYTLASVYSHIYLFGTIHLIYINIIVLFLHGRYFEIFEFLIHSLLKHLFKKGMLKLNILGYQNNC